MQKQSQKSKGVHQYTLKTAQRQAFLQIFHLHAKEGKINRIQLKQMFDRVGYVIFQQHFSDICQKVFEFKQQVTFQQLMEIFRIKDSPYNLVDIKNAFRLIAGEQDEFIALDIIYEIFRKNGIQKQRIDDLMQVLSSYVDSQKKAFNYKEFIGSIS